MFWYYFFYKINVLNGSGKEKVDYYMYDSFSLPIMPVADARIRPGRILDMGEF